MEPTAILLRYVLRSTYTITTLKASKIGEGRGGGGGEEEELPRVEGIGGN